MSNLENRKDKYYVKLIEAASPVTKMPSTPFRLATLGLLEVEGCYLPKETYDVGLHQELPSSNSVLPYNDDSGIECLAYIEELIYEGEERELVEVEIDHAENLGLLTEIVYTGEDEDISFSFNAENGNVFVSAGKVGEYNIPFTVYYSECPVCELEIELIIEEAPEPEHDRCIPENTKPDLPSFIKDNIEVKRSTCNGEWGFINEIHKENLLENTYKWELAETGRNVNQDISAAYGETVDLSTMGYWEGMVALIKTYADDGTGAKIVDYENGVIPPLEQLLPHLLDSSNTITETWKSFHDSGYLAYGLGECTSSALRASFWLTSQLGVVTVVDDLPTTDWLLEPIVLHEFVDRMKATGVDKLVNLIRVRDNAQDTANTTLGAFYLTQPDAHSFLGVINIEPELSRYTYESSISFSPADYKHRSEGGNWYDFTYDLPDEYTLFHYDNTMPVDEKRALTYTSVVYHELAHAIDYAYGRLTGTNASATNEFLTLSGWGNKETLRKTEWGIPNEGTVFPVTPYGTSSATEDFAEAYMMYKYNPKFMCYYHVERYEYVKKVEETVLSSSGTAIPEVTFDCENCKSVGEGSNPTDPNNPPVDPPADLPNEDEFLFLTLCANLIGGNNKYKAWVNDDFMVNSTTIEVLDDNGEPNHQPQAIPKSALKNGDNKLVIEVEEYDSSTEWRIMLTDGTSFTKEQMRDKNTVHGGGAQPGVRLNRVAPLYSPNISGTPEDKYGKFVETGTTRIEISFYIQGVE